ncbi:ABC transporter substrate-binding protein [Microbacterium sp.]|uniref:ABC transporter substrate-binding protein n=1 Tax=Microbacterium sp. TaxID=51671 RepID=UPI003A92D9C2
MPSLPVRRLLPLAALAAASALVLSACAGPASDSGAKSGANPDAEITWAIEGANLSNGKMDPQSSQLDSTAMVQRQVLDSLVYQEADGTFSPWLAKSWKVSDDGKTYTFTLRDDVTFTDGTVFDAAAVKANFDRIVDPKTESAQAAAMLGGDLYAGTKVIDPHTVEVDFTKPYAPFLQAASTAQLGFWSPKVIKSAGDQIKAGGPDVNVGTGPFTMTSYTANQEIVYTRNDDYAWGPDGAKAPKVKTLRVELLPEASVRAGVVVSGEAQITSNLPPSAVKSLGKDITVTAKEYPGLPYSLFLNEKYGVFADQNVRHAFELSIDVDAAVKQIFFGQFPRAWSILGPTTPGYDASLEGTWTFDPEKANQLLDEAGWTTRDSDGYRTKDGKRLSARWIAWTPVSDEHTAMANAIQSDLKKVGFEIKRETLEPAAYNEQYGPRTYDITDWDFSGVDPDLLRSHLGTDGFQNASVVSDPAVDKLLQDGLSTTDPAARAKIYQQVQQWNAENVAIVPLYVSSAITATSKDVKDLTYDLYGRPLFYTVSLAG